MKSIILASASPRRRELLKRIGLTFKVDPSRYDEPKLKETDPHKLVRVYSREKAKNVSKRYSDALVIGADTLVVYDGEILGKPHTKKRAREMLRKLSNNKHSVITGFTIIDTKTNKEITQSVESTVYFRKLSDKEINAYIATGEPLDKAGAYAVQEKACIFVKKVEGDFFNIVGLPVINVYTCLKSFGIPVL